MCFHSKKNSKFAKSHYDLKKLNLADFNLNNVYLLVDILITTDLYWSVDLDEVIKEKGGPVAINLKVAFILSGTVNIKENTAPSSVLISHVLENQ